MSKANNSVVSMLSTLIKHATISQSVSRKLMQPLGVELTGVNCQSKTKLTEKVRCFRLGGKKLNGSLNKAKIFTVSYKSHRPTETY